MAIKVITRNNNNNKKQLKSGSLMNRTFFVKPTAFERIVEIYVKTSIFYKNSWITLLKLKVGKLT